MNRWRDLSSITAIPPHWALSEKHDTLAACPALPCRELREVSDGRVKYQDFSDNRSLMRVIMRFAVLFSANESLSGPLRLLCGIIII